MEDLAAFFVPPRSAYTSQVPRLFSEPLRDNILMGLPDGRTDLDGAVHAAVMEEDVAELEDGLDTVVGARGVKLSGGQLRRSAAARMFVREPELLVFDDLSSGLDVETERELWGTPVRAGGRDGAGGLAPAGGAAPGGPHRGDEGRARRGRGHAGRAAGGLCGDAPTVGRGRGGARGWGFSPQRAQRAQREEFGGGLEEPDRARASTSSARAQFSESCSSYAMVMLSFDRLRTNEFRIPRELSSSLVSAYF